MSQKPHTHDVSFEPLSKQKLAEEYQKHQSLKEPFP